MNEDEQQPPARKRRAGKRLGAIAVVGIASVMAPKAALADETVPKPSHASIALVGMARAVIAELLAHTTSTTETASASNAAPSLLRCGCTRAGNGKGPPKRIACDGTEAASARAAGELGSTCGQ